jgi:hypothetical protein
MIFIEGASLISVAPTACTCWIVALVIEYLIALTGWKPEAATRFPGSSHTSGFREVCLASEGSLFLPTSESYDAIVGVGDFSSPDDIILPIIPIIITMIIIGSIRLKRLVMSIREKPACDGKTRLWDCIGTVRVCSGLIGRPEGKFMIFIDNDFLFMYYLPRGEGGTGGLLPSLPAFRIQVLRLSS